MKAYTDYMLDTMTASESQRAEYAEAIATLSPRERFGLMLGAMVGEDELANMLDAVDYENDILDRQFWAEGC